MSSNLKSTRYGINPKIPHPDDRPKCKTKGCDRPIAIISTLKDGTPNYRKVCYKCHQANIAKKHGVKSAHHLTAQRRGMTVTELKNSRHPSRKNRKTYCENIDGRLGYRCTAHIYWLGMLDVDHIDGDSSNNHPDNHQTLCKCCHAYKTWLNEDAKTPGRKTIRRQKQMALHFAGIAQA